MIKYYSKKTGFDYVILRLFNVYGEGQGTGSLIPDIIKKYSSKERVDIISPDSAVDMIFLEDVVKVLIESMKKHGTFNVCTGIPTRILDIYHKIKSNMGIKEAEEKILRGKRSYLVGDKTKFKRNFQTKMRTLESGLKDMFKN
jgi:nucleoside-diphosphate-sugar epimerase